MSGLSFTLGGTRVCIRLIIDKEIVGVAIISFVSTGVICEAVEEHARPRVWWFAPSRTTR